MVGIWLLSLFMPFLFFLGVSDFALGHLTTHGTPLKGEHMIGVGVAYTTMRKGTIEVLDVYNARKCC